MRLGWCRTRGTRSPTTSATPRRSLPAALVKPSARLASPRRPSASRLCEPSTSMRRAGAAATTTTTARGEPQAPPRCLTLGALRAALSRSRRCRAQLRESLLTCVLCLSLCLCVCLSLSLSVCRALGRHSGAAGGRRPGQGNGGAGAAYANTSRARLADLGSTLPARPSGTVWRAGSVAEVAFTTSAFHGGGYSYR